MPHILVLADTVDGESSEVLLQERVLPELLQSPHYASQLVERVQWAVQDAAHVERTGHEHAEVNEARRGGADR